MKWAKYALIAVAPLVLILGVWSAMRDGRSSLPDSYQFVDVVTGDVFDIDRSDLSSIPAPNKRDGKLTMFPIETDAEGRLVIGERYRDAFIALSKSQPVKVDTETFVVPPSVPVK